MDYWKKDWFIIGGLLIHHFQFNDLWGFCVGGTNINCSSQFSSSPECYIKFKKRKNKFRTRSQIFFVFFEVMELDEDWLSFTIISQKMISKRAASLNLLFFASLKNINLHMWVMQTLMIIDCSIKKNFCVVIIIQMMNRCLDVAQSSIPSNVYHLPHNNARKVDATMTTQCICVVLFMY